MFIKKKLIIIIPDLGVHCAVNHQCENTHKKRKKLHQKKFLKNKKIVIEGPVFGVGIPETLNRERGWKLLTLSGWPESDG